MADHAPAVAQDLADWVAALSLDAVPADVLAQCKLLAIDTIGVGVAGTRDKVGAAIRRWSAGVSSGHASALSVSERKSPADAAFINGTLCHALDFDDGAYGGHASACVLPAAIASAEGERDSDRSVLLAYIAGMEVFGSMAACAGTKEIHELGFHPTSIFGLMGATVAAGRARNLSAAQLANAISIAASSGCGVTANFGTMTKALHVGMVASAGVRAVELAVAGFAGNLSALEAKRGFGHAYLRSSEDWHRFTANLGNPFRLSSAGPTIKQYPSCGGNHRAIGNLLTLLNAEDISYDQINTVEVHVNPRLLNILSFDWPTDSYQARFCLPFNIAATMVAGAPNLETFYDDFLKDVRLDSAREKVRIVTDNPAESRRAGARVVLRLTDGTRRECDSDIVPGSPAAPLGRERIVAKFRYCCGPSISAELAEALAESAIHLDEENSRFLAVWRALCCNSSPREGG